MVICRLFPTTVAAFRELVCSFVAVFGEVVFAAFYASGYLSTVSRGVAEPLTCEALRRARCFVCFNADTDVEERC